MISINNRLFCFFIALLCFVSCSKSVTDDDNKVIVPEEPEVIRIDEFAFLVDKNEFLLNDLFLKETNSLLTGELSKFSSKILTASFKTNAKSVEVNGVKQVSGVTANDFSKDVKYSFVGEKGGKKDVTVRFTWKNSDIPHISISIDNNAEVVVKDTYLNASLTVNGGDLYPSYAGTTKIRGRGNSTWGYPKKPYRLNLDTKSEILGLEAAKNWVLLANYLDPSLMCNSVAMKIGQALEVPFTNTTIPVDLTINGTYRGSYVLTQHLEVGTDRINITDEGYLLELDDYYDEDFKFKSANYQLPVMIKSPDLKGKPAADLTAIQEDFEAMESLVKAGTFPNNGYRDKLDIDVFARYMLVYFLTGNEELNHPKSTYMHKKLGGKYSFGPIWDFDWAYGYEGGAGHFTNPNKAFFWNINNVNYQGTHFFSQLMTDPEVRKAFKLHWTSYKAKHFDNLLKYIDDYSEFISTSYSKNATKWNTGKQLSTETAKMKAYLNARKTYIDTYTQNF